MTGPRQQGESGERQAGGLGRRLLQRADRYQRAHHWAAFPLAVAKKFGEDQASNLAVLIAYYGFFSIFPLLLALVAILGFVLSGNPQLQERILDTALANFPVIGDQLRENVGALEGSVVALVVGVAGALWAGLAAVTAAENAFDAVWDVPMKERPGFVSAKLRALVMLAVIGAGVLISTLLAGAGSGREGLDPAARLFGLGTSLLLNVALFLLAFKVLTHVKAGWRAFLPGALVAGVAWLALQAAGGWLVTRQLQDAGETYGVFAVVIALLTWLYIQAQVTLLAAEINVVRHERLWPRSLTGQDLTRADVEAFERYAEEAEQVEQQENDVRLEHDRTPAQQAGDRRAQGAQPPERAARR